MQYGADADHDVSMRVVADHIRATTFLIGDGVIPSNEWRGYVLRKIMRRAMRHGKHLGLTEPFLHSLVGVLVREMGEAYPELRSGRDMIEKTILAEEHRFEAVLTEGLPRLEAEIAKALATAAPGASGRSGVPAVRHLRHAVRLHRGHGRDARRLASTRRRSTVAMEAQRGKARAQSAFGGEEAARQFVVDDEAGAQERRRSVRGIHEHPPGGRARRWRCSTSSGSPSIALSAGATDTSALARTPFYLESGGQVSDVGPAPERSRRSDGRGRAGSRGSARACRARTASACHDGRVAPCATS